jgi:hypothetical protein
MDIRTAIIAAAFVDEARRVRASGHEFWNEAAADHAYSESVKIADAFEAARDRAMAAGEMKEGEEHG